MRLLLDTHVILWAAIRPDKLPAAARKLLENSRNELIFSVVSLWEIAIKHALGRADFRIDPHVLRRGLLESNYVELPILAEHVLATVNLPPLHHDPFDRLLVAQALAEGMVLLTVDEALAGYSGPVRVV
ncbi:MAG: type II toxin-antitoxin system VapC family toxin [Rhodanobacter sp.]|nr:type II toxin-antitoxin system VapC family toxin [Rhodanobacter sp.]